MSVFLSIQELSKQQTHKAFRSLIIQNTSLLNPKSVNNACPISSNYIQASNLWR